MKSNWVRSKGRKPHGTWFTCILVDFEDTFITKHACGSFVKGLEWTYFLQIIRLAEQIMCKILHSHQINLNHVQLGGCLLPKVVHENDALTLSKSITVQPPDFNSDRILDFIVDTKGTKVKIGKETTLHIWYTSDTPET